MKCKRLLCTLLALVIVLCMIPLGAIPAKAATTLTLAQLQEKFPEGKYWNHKTPGRSNNNPDRWTETPCSCHGRGYCVADTKGDCRCNSFDGAVQCAGFAYKLAFDAYGTKARGWANGSLASLKAGDVVRYKNDGHSIWVTAVNGDTITYADCNSDDNASTCIINWNKKISKSTIASSLTWIKSAPYALGGGNTTTHTVDSSYGTNFTAYPKAKITAANIFDANHNQISSGAWIGTSDLCTIHEVYTDGCCKVTYPLDNGGTKTVYSKISLFNTHTHSYTGSRYYEPTHPHAYWQKCVDYDTCGGWTYTGEYRSDVKTCEQCWHMTFNVGAPSVSVKVGESKTISFSASGCKPDSAVAYDSFSPDNGVVSVSIKNQQATFTGLKAGTTNYSVTIYSDSSKSRVIGSVTIPVTVTNQTYALTGNSTNNATVTTGGEMKYYTYTPTTSSKYVIYSTGSDDTRVYLYNANWTELASDDDGGDNRNFRLEYSLNAGTKYIFGIKYYNSSTTGSISFKFGNVYTVTYNANGGSGAPAAQSKDYGAEITLSSTKPTRTGYTFLGWSTSSTATSASYQSGSNFTTNANTTLYAVWKLDPIEIRRNSTNGAVVSIGGEMQYFTYTPVGNYEYVIYSTGSDDTKVYLYDANMTELSSNDDGGEGYNFRLEFSLNAGEQYIFGVKYYDTSKTGTISFKFVNMYTVTYNANGGAGEPSGQRKEYGTDIILSSTKPTQPGYTFLGWSTSSTATSATYQPGGNFTSNGNTTLYAVWKKGCESNAHRYVNTVTAPTCTAQGYTTHTCSLCGNSYKDTYVNATGHSYSYKATKAPTTSATGTLTGTCSKCSGTTTVTLPKLTATDYSYAVIKAATCTANGTGRYTWKTTTYGSFYFDETIYTKGHNYGQNVTAPTCTAQGYTTHTCSLCGNSYKDTYTNATGHSYVDGICSSCGEKDPDYQPMIQWAGSNVTLGGALALNFAFDTAQLDGTTGNYIVLTRSYADGKEDDVVTIPQSEWVFAGGTYIQVSYTNMAAKEMGDKITAVIYNAAGKAISETRTDSMAEYSMRMLVRADIVASAEKRTLFVDMLNYGAAAQVYFDYDAENLVNATLTEEQAGWASAAVKIDNYRQSSGCYLGSSLSLEEEIYLKVAFGVVCEEGMYATVSFTDHYGTQVEKQVPIEADGSYTIVRVEGMAIADYRGLVTCKLYSASGAELGSTIDSIESYASRMASALQKNGVDLGDAIMKLGASSDAFFH